MADMTPLTDILNDDPASATPVQNNFQTIEAYINGTDLVRTDGTEVMAADLDMDGNKVVNLADGSADDDAMAYGQRSRLAGHWTASQATTSSWVALSFDAEVADIGTYGATGSGVITVPTAGLYAVVVTWARTSGSGNARVRLTSTDITYTPTSGEPQLFSLAASGTVTVEISYDSFSSTTSTDDYIVKIHRLV